MKKTVAFLFPGQGRVPEEFPPPSPEVNHLFEIASRRDLPLRKWITDGATDRLSQTDAMQPALLIDGVGRAVALRAAGSSPAFVAGHSLGEFAALTCAGVVTASAVLGIVIERGRLMQQVVGEMVAIVRLDLDTVRQLCEASGADISIANHNGPRQVVVSGKHVALGRLVAAAERAGGRAIPLRVSGPFHSPFMKPAQDGLAAIIERTTFSPPSVRIVSGVSGRIERDAHRLKELMLVQMTACVRWVDVVRQLEASNVTHAVEVGSGEVLTGLGKRITNRIQFMTYEEAIDGGV
jgi:[acyl-carrier-protein] S-malonyltransferase